MKNKRVLFFLFAFAILIILPFVSAAVQYDSDFNFLQDGAERLVKLISAGAGPFFDILLGEYSGGFGEFSEGEILFIRILLFIIIFVIINSVVKTMPLFGDNRGVLLIISVSVSILAVRYLSKSNLILGIFLPYGVLGATIATILPFMIFFFFLHASKMQGLGRRLGWLVFGIVFLALFVPRYSTLPNTTQWIYFGCIIVIALSFFFDRGIHRYFALHEVGLFVTSANKRAASMLQGEYLNIINVDSPEAKNRRAEIEAKLKELGIDLP